MKETSYPGSFINVLERLPEGASMGGANGAT